MPKASPSYPPIHRHLIRIACLSWGIGLLAALLECLCLQLFGGLYPHAPLDLVEILLLTSAYAVGSGILFGLFFFLAGRKFPLFLQPAFAPAVLVSFWLFFILGDWIHEVWLTGIEIYRPSGLAATAVLLIGTVAIGLGFYRVGKRLTGGRVWLRLFAGIGLLLAVTEALLLVLHRPAETVFGDKPKQDLPHIFLMTIDTLRADHLSCYGYERPTTPVLDSLAEKGVLFRKHYAQSSWTRPSTASLLTGLLPAAHGANQINEKLRDEFVTLAEILAQQGYRTAAFSANAVVSPLFGFDQGFDHFWCGEDFPYPRFTSLYRVLDKFGLPRNILRSGVHQVSPDARDVNEAALPWIEKNRAGSLFVYFHYMDPHSPYGPPEYLLPGPVPAPASLYPPQAYPGSVFPFVKAPELDEKDRQDLLDLYDAEIRFCDREIGVLIRRLEEMGLTEDAVFIITSDHGEEFYEHFGWEHGKSLYEEVLAVPLICYGPSHFPAGKVVTGVTSSVDLFPALCDLVGATIPYALPGKKLNLAAVRPAEPPTSEEVFAEVRRSGFEIYSLLTPPYKGISIQHGNRNAMQVFDLEKDPQERQCLTRVDTVLSAELRDALQRKIEESRGSRVAAEEVPMDSRTLEKLKALGYIQ